MGHEPIYDFIYIYIYREREREREVEIHGTHLTNKIVTYYLRSSHTETIKVDEFILSNTHIIYIKPASTLILKLHFHVQFGVTPTCFVLS